MSTPEPLPKHVLRFFDFLKIRLVYYVNNCLYVCFNQGGTGVPNPPYSVFAALLMSYHTSVPGGCW